MAAEDAPQIESEVVSDPALAVRAAGDLGELAMTPEAGDGGDPSATIGGQEMTLEEARQIGIMFDRGDLEYRPYLKR